MAGWVRSQICSDQDYFGPHEAPQNETKENPEPFPAEGVLVMGEFFGGMIGAAVELLGCIVQLVLIGRLDNVATTQKPNGVDAGDVPAAETGNAIQGQHPPSSHV